MSRLRILIALITNLVFSGWTWSGCLWIIRGYIRLTIISFESWRHTFGGRERGDDLDILFYSRVSRRNQLGGRLVLAQFESRLLLLLIFLRHHHLVWLKSCWRNKCKFLSCQILLRIGLFSISLQSSILISGSCWRDPNARAKIIQLGRWHSRWGSIGCLSWRFGLV